MAINTRRHQVLTQRAENFVGLLVGRFRMPKYLPVAFGIAGAALVASSALAMERSKLEKLTVALG
jgi:hypothetical protein